MLSLRLDSNPQSLGFEATEHLCNRMRNGNCWKSYISVGLKIAKLQYIRDIVLPCDKYTMFMSGISVVISLRISTLHFLWQIYHKVTSIAPVYRILPVSRECNNTCKTAMNKITDDFLMLEANQWEVSFLSLCSRLC